MAPLQLPLQCRDNCNGRRYDHGVDIEAHGTALNAPDSAMEATGTGE